MPNQPMLDRLCALCGIEPEYTDFWGNRHPTSEATKLALLATMHVDADVVADPERALAECEAQSWRRMLAPVQVIPEADAAPQVALTMPVSMAEVVFGWRLTLESGEISSGQSKPADLAVLEQRDIAGVSFVRYVFPLPAVLASGYHRLEIDAATDDAEADGLRRRSAAMRLIVVPAACFLPPALAEQGRVWGLAVQLYALRSQRNWGIGDFADLRAVVEFAAQAGAGFVGTNPLHALFPSYPARISPYSPSSRRFLNVLYLDVEGIEDFAECEAARNTVREPRFQAHLRTLRASELVNYEQVAALKLQVLELLYRHFREHHLDRGSQRASAFRAFQAQGGEALRSQALFDALQEHFVRSDSTTDTAIHGWHQWPEDYRDPASGPVAAFAAAQVERIEFHAYLQWIADLQLAAVGQRSLELGLGAGLYQDIAVGVAADGAECWREQALYARHTYIGAPADEYNTLGQDWGLPPLIPQRLREVAYAPFIETLRENMRHAGALRLDHVMGLMRQFWVPAGGIPSAGTYVNYPFADLLGIVALESHRNRCMVIGEDLGTVPPEVRDALARSAVLSYRLLYFEKDQDGGFKAPADYPAQSLVAVSTHDLPTLAGYWLGHDIDLRCALDLFPSVQLRDAQLLDRSQSRTQLLMALERAELLPAGASVNPVAHPEMTEELSLAVHIYLARTPAKFMVVQLEDILGQVEQVNFPASGGKYPNWQRKLTLDLEHWALDSRVQTLTTALRQVRGSGIFPAAGAIAHAAPQFAPHVTHIPRATYRLQFNREFTFTQAEQLIPYLDALGISHCYASPYFKARPGSMHGYDIIDHNAFNPEIGGDSDFDRYVEALQRHGMGQIIDIVPNHMGVMGSDNEWWLEVLENGQSALHAEFFDIDWSPLKEELRGKVLVPVLGDQYGNVLESGGLRLVFDRQRGEFSIWYDEHRFPLDPREYPRITGRNWEQLAAKLGADHPQVLEFQSLNTAFGHLPPRTDLTPEQRAERSRDKEIHKRHLAALCAACGEIALFVQQNVDEFSGDPDNPQSFDLLHQLIKVQAYRFANWRVAADEINYRRFFDVNSLAGLRMEREEVFDATHRLVFDLIASGKVDGVRIDHPDGLYDPLQYLHRLRQGRASTAPETDPAGVAADHSGLYIVLEKIIASYEHMPAQWPVHGSTGYRFCNVVNGLFVDAANEERMERVYAAFIGERIDFNEQLYRCKKLIMRVVLASELNVLANQLDRIAQLDRHTCDFTANSLRDALIEITACFPVYRTYVTADAVSEDDRNFIGWAISAAKRRSQAADISIFDFVRETLLTSIADGKGQAYRDTVTRFAMKFQQFTGPVMAKGMEDTSFYIYHRLTSLNEVGGDPRTFGITLAAFHAASQDRAKNWPHTMLATSTHDGKRSEDVRARINTLSEMPALWKLRLRRWSRLNYSKRVPMGEVGASAPARNDEYLLYQTLVGAWPLEPLDPAVLAGFCERIEHYMQKAIREAKINSSWINPNPEYESAVSKFIKAILAPGRNPFLADFLPLQRLTSRLGMFNSLSQTLIKLTSPGVPDIYQGNELWDFSLADPDNRRPVDYRRRSAMLEQLKTYFAVDPGQFAERAGALLQTMEDGRIKLYLTWRTLELRRQCEILFRDGDYLPLQAEGSRAEHVCAFARSSKEAAVMVVAPRFFYALLGDGDRVPAGAEFWAGTGIELPEGLAGNTWRNVFTDEIVCGPEPGGRRLGVAGLLAHFPFALLHRIVG
ncbi:MAG: malto-oligosyltrehalose synthase [Oxalobacteraceae bacterium]|nr:malto-oligosyltrehalose synthase [Oxalobacteraceae bacterium]